MWSKNKTRTIPISTKLTAFYAVILFLTLLFCSLLTVAGLSYVLFMQANDDIKLSVSSVKRYLGAGYPIDQHMLTENIMFSDAILRIFDEKNTLLIDSAPGLPVNPSLSDKDDDGGFIDQYSPLRHFPRIVHINHATFFFCKEYVPYNGHLYLLQVLLPTSDEIHFLLVLSKSLIVTNLLGLLLAILSGTFMSKKFLRPIHDITDTAKIIEINNLDKRMSVPQSKDELQELIQTFNHMLNRIQSGVEQQRRFVSDASHELRTPITVISGYIDMLDRWGKQDIAILEESISAIKSEAASMYELIENLLFLARSDQHNYIIHRQPLDIALLVNDIFQETRLIAPNHTIELLHNDPVVIQADSTSLKQMLRIFIENSIKYTPAGGVISILSQVSENHLEITVKDTGIGISPEDSPKVFERFFRVEQSRSKTTGGTGLGLSIAQRIAQHHNSTIALASKLGEGTAVTVKVPLT